MQQLLELYQIAQEEKISIEFFSLPENESMTVVIEDEYFIGLDPHQILNLADEKYKLAHELGHCITGCIYTRYCLYELIGRCEYRAEKWAIKKLIPKDKLYKLYKDGYVESWDIAEKLDLPEEIVKKAMLYYHEQDLAG